MSVLSGLFEKIKSAFGAGRPGKDEIIQILSESFENNFFAITGGKTIVTLSAIRTEEFEKQLTDIQAGFLACGLGDSDRPRFVMLYPAECVRKLLPVIKERHNRTGESDAVLAARAMDLVLGNVPRLVRAGMMSPGEIGPADFLTMRKSYADTDRDALLWHASGCAVFQGTVGPYEFFLLVDEETEHVLRLNLDDRAFRKAAWGLAQADYDPVADLPAPAAVAATLRIVKPKEFIAGNLLLPQVAAFDRYRLQSVFKSITSGSDDVGQFDNGLWIHMFLSAGGPEINLYCHVAGQTRQGFAERFGNPSGFFKNVLQHAVLFLRTTFPGIQITSVKLAIDSRPDESAIARSLVLKGELVVNYTRMEMAVCAPTAYFSLLFPQVLKPWEYGSSINSPADFLTAVMSFNATLFNRNIGTFMKKYRGGLAYLPANTTCIPLYELMDLMDDRDLRILLQNLLVPKYSAGIARLFNIGVPVQKEGPEEGGERRMKIFQVAYDRERINRMMPPLVAEEMDRLKEYTPAEEFDSYNKAVLKEISRSISAGTVMFSYKTRYIFIHEIFDIINEEEARRLGELRTQGIPFAGMRKLSRSSLINFVNKIGNHDFCLSVIDSDADIPLLVNCMSRSRKRQFMDDLEYYRQRYMKGTLTAEDIITAKRRINSLLEEKRTVV